MTQKCAVILLWLRDSGERQEILLQRLQNTGYADGMWDFACSGHVELGESMKQALCREAEEELGWKAE